MEIRTGKAIVRIHGTPEQDRLKEATVKFLKGANKCRKEKSKTSS